jgi:lipoate-protein ligase A
MNEAIADAETYSFTEEDIKAISKLRDEKYSTYDWNFGSSPEYTFTRKLKTAGGHIEVALIVEGGIIKQARFFGDYFHINDPAEIESALIGVPHQEAELRKRFSNFPLENIS